MVKSFARCEFLSIKFDIEQIGELMKSFYMMSGIRFVLFDSDFKEVTSYPEENCEFCKIMKSCPKTRRKCQYADRRSFKKCEENNSIVMYKCHAGLVEAVIPLHEGEKIIGYLMFGQIADSEDKEFLTERLQSLCKGYNLDSDTIQNGIENITYKTSEQIHAAAKIMQACTGYIIYKELITPESNRTFEAAKKYIEEHLSDDFSITALCSALNIGRTKLYHIFKSECKMGISEYLNRRRMHRAKKLLKTTELSIPEIASSVGFNDYNYFSRVYKKVYGKSPKKYR